MKFSTFCPEVLELRDEQGIRGIDRERSRHRCHIVPAAFYEKEIGDISAPEIREWLRWMSTRLVQKPGSDRKLTRATINRCMSLVSATFTEAVERELISVNPCNGVKAKRRVDASDTVQKWSYLTMAEQQRLAACASIPMADRLACRFAIATGLRQGEQFALKLADLLVDAENPRVLVRLGRPHKGQDAPPKSGKPREVPLFGDGLVCAREWLAMLPSYAPSNPSGLVFPSQRGCMRQQGKPLGAHGVMKAHYVAAGIPLRKGLHWHSHRHTFGSNLVSGVLGRPWRLEEIQVVMGHSSIMITQRYAHLGADAITKAARETVLVVPASSVVEAIDVPVECMPEREPSRWSRIASLAMRTAERLGRDPLTSRDAGGGT